MGEFLGRDALTGLAITDGEAVVAIPISYKGLPEESRFTELDQGWRISGLPVRTVYTGYGETQDLPAPEIPRPDNPFVQKGRGHLFIIKESLYEKLLKEGLADLSDTAEYLPEDTLYKGVTSIDDCLDKLSEKPFISRLEIFKYDLKPAYFSNWYSPEFLPNFTFTDSEDVRKLLELFVFINGALGCDFPALVPSYPSGAQVSMKEKVVLEEALEVLNKKLERYLDFDDYEGVEDLLAEVKAPLKTLKNLKKDCEKALEEL